MLLHGTVYLANLAGPGSREWTPLQAGGILSGLAATLFVAGWLLRSLSCRTPRYAVPLAMAVACGGAAVAIMLSGYMSGGLLGLPLAAAIGGAWLAALVTAAPGEDAGLVSVAAIGLFALVVIGRFFGELTTGHAVALFLAPLAGWLTALPFVRRWPPWLVGAGQVLLTAIPVAVVLFLARQNFVKSSAAPSSSSDEDATASDYLNFGQ
jgi:MFS family permease